MGLPLIVVVIGVPVLSRKASTLENDRPYPKPTQVVR